MNTADARAGMAWWNALTEADRRFWFAAALTAIPAQAWAYRCRVVGTSDLENRR